jgi:hypothetical protein
VAIDAKRLAIVENCRAPKAVGVSMMSVPPSGQLAAAAAAFASSSDEELAALSSREETPRVTYLSRVHRNQHRDAAVQPLLPAIRKGRTPASCRWEDELWDSLTGHEMIIR